MFNGLIARVFNLNLRVRMAILVVIPIMLAMLFFSLSQYYNERSMIEKQLEQNTSQLGDLLLGSLRHSMLNNDRQLSRELVAGVTQNKSISRIWIINLNNEVKISNQTDEEGNAWSMKSPGCDQCHKYPVDNQPRVIINILGNDGLMRVATPILNLQECWACHDASKKYVGVLLIDTPLPDSEKNLLAELRTNLILSVCFSLLIGLVAYLLINFMVIQRIENLHNLLKHYTSGNFEKRVPISSGEGDEITALGQTFNRMADRLAEHEALVIETARVRETAIVEERERIARELHDGIAQFLGYITTKTQAAHLFIEKGDIQKADAFMRQIESETQKQALDVRASILGLKMVSGERQGLASDIRKYLNQSNMFMDIEVIAEVAPELENLLLPPETELQMMRIMQESISNVRKHSQAQTARVLLEQPDKGLVEMTIIDNGVGFDLKSVGAKGQPHFGLATMRERAESIGASFDVKSSPGSGTVIFVTLGYMEKDR